MTNKYRNKKIEAYGIKFDSTREKYMYDCLTEANIPFVFQKKYVILEGFRNRFGKKVRDATAIVDFVVEVNGVTYIIDVKGLFLPIAKLKYKMLEKQLFDKGEEYVMYFPKNKTMIKDIVEELKRYLNGDTILLSV